MKVDIHSLWDESKNRGQGAPNVYLYLKPENDAERALMVSLYGARMQFIPQTTGEHVLDFYPSDRKRDKKLN